MKKNIQISLIFIIALIFISATIDLNNLFNYQNQTVPEYILMDNTSAENTITDKGATLGRVLFYDKKLSSNNTISCASCHKQEFAFSDKAQFSQGVNGETLRHSMRLINSRFSEESKFFWDERAISLEDQATKPIKDHIEMGFSGTNGDPNFQDLIVKLSETTYYPKLFTAAFGEAIINEEKIAKALAQFIRSIQSFDSKYDKGLALVTNHLDDFPNFTSDENTGKRLFTENYEYEIEEVTIKQFKGDVVATVAHRKSGGLNCASCHRPPEFDIDPNSLNNGFDRPLNGQPIRNRDFTVTRSATLRDLINPNGGINEVNSPLFHGGTTTDIAEGILANYNFKEIHEDNNNLDARLAPEGYPQFLEMTNLEIKQLVDFLNTLSGKDVYTNEEWSNPFDASGELEVFFNSTNTEDLATSNISVYPNPPGSWIPEDSPGSHYNYHQKPSG